MAINADGLIYPASDASPEADARQDAREALIYNVTEDLAVCLERLGISRAELARRLEKKPSYISRALSGTQNMTLATFSDFCQALGFVAEVRVGGAEAILIPERRGDAVEEDSVEGWTPLSHTDSVSFRAVGETVIECDAPQWYTDAA